MFWVEDLVPEGFLKRRMFGGVAFYFDEKLMLVLFESEGNKSYRGEKFDFELWNGCMFPVEKPNHPAILEKFPFLINHPILPKWLYLPAESENFEGKVELLMRELRRLNPLMGSVPKAKGGAGKKKTAGKPKRGKEEPEILDTRRPRMFGEEPVEVKLKTAKKISDLKNLGPSAEAAFHKAGIKTAPQFIKLGWKKTMVRLCKSNPKNNHSVFAYAVIGALQGKMWNLIPEADKQEARVLMKALREKEKGTGKATSSRRTGSARKRPKQRK